MNNSWSFMCAFCMLLTFPVFSQNNFWLDIDETASRSSGGERWIVPDKYRSLELEVGNFSQLLKETPMRNSGADEFSEITLPMPDGTFEVFAIQESPIMEEKLADKNPDIKTFSGHGVNDPSLAVYLDLTPKGFHGMILGPGKSIFIDPYFKEGNDRYVCYHKRDFSLEEMGGFPCGYIPSDSPVPSENMSPISNRNASVTLRTYRIAIAATGEYTAYHGSAANALAAINTTLNRVRGIYETELAISFTLVGNNNLIVYSNAASDPYSDTPTLTENQNNIDAVIGNANYDIGHLVDQGGNGGVAGLGVTCVSSNKAKGMTSNAAPMGDPYDVDFVAHEIGHQMGAEHTFNGNLGSCSGGTRNASTAYEPNSGSTIMAYAGICGSQNIQYRTESHFHQISLQEITDFVINGNGSTCPTSSATGNNTPSVDANAEGVDGKYIPINTPFELTATGSDPDGHPLYFCWEQWDLGTEGTAASSSNGPIFRSFHPKMDGTRTFPRLSNILDNTTSNGEYLPSITRDLTFKCTVRDGQVSGGGTGVDEITLHVTNSASDFAIASHNTSAQVEGQITVNWNVGNTTSAPVNCANVDILLSTDGGEHFTTLATNTANDGSETVTLPNNATGQARLKVKCSDNVFFDINNADLRIAPADATCAEQVTNGNFASGTSGWMETSALGQSIINGWGEGRSNAFCPWFGYLDNETARVSQTVTIPASPRFAKLEFWYRFLRFDCGGDQFNIKVNDVIIQTIDLCNNDAATGWKRALVDLSAYEGTSPTFMFELITDGSQPTDLLIDDVSLYTCVGGTFAILPVEMTDFQVVKNKGNALLKWQTQNETNNRGFEIEQKFEDGNFRKIGFVAGKGTTHIANEYDFTVTNLEVGTHYFRLRQMDMDGASTYSPVRSLRVFGEQKVNVFPNPSSDVVFFETVLENESDLRLEIMNASGQVVQTLTEDRFASGHFMWSMDISELPKGVYFFQMNGNGFEENGKFIVE